MNCHPLLFSGHHMVLPNTLLAKAMLRFTTPIMSLNLLTKALESFSCLFPANLYQ